MMPKILLSFVTLFIAVPAFATLGEPEASIDGVRRAIPRSTRAPAIRRAQGTSTFTVHEIKNAGTTIREYVSSNGTVFAVTWTGYRTPNTKVLLGKYNNDLRSLQARQPRQKGARARTLSSNRLVAIRSGHPRALRGRYIDPTLVPAGVKTNDIQ